MAATLAVAPAVLAFDAAPAAATNHVPTVTVTTTAAPGRSGAISDSVKETFRAEEDDFFDGGLGRRLRHLCTGLAIVGGVLAVARASAKGLFKSGGQGGGGMQGGGGGGGVGQYFKQLIMPLVACAMLLNLNWTFGGIEWTAAIGGDVFEEVQSWVDTTPDGT